MNNAAVYDTSAFLNLEVATYEHLLRVGVMAPMLLTQLTAKDMIAKSISGSIINVSSISGHRPYPNRVAHSSAKAALNMLTQSTALELAAFGIRVNGISPGATPYDGAAVDPSFRIPLQRGGTPEDQAAAALYLASLESSWMTGQMLTVDGGQSLTMG